MLESTNNLLHVTTERQRDIPTTLIHKIGMSKHIFMLFSSLCNMMKLFIWRFFKPKKATGMMVKLSLQVQGILQGIHRFLSPLKYTGPDAMWTAADCEKQYILFFFPFSFFVLFITRMVAVSLL